MPQSEAWRKAGRAILTAARNELYLNLPFLDAALCALSFSDEQDTDFIATDGQSLFFSGRDVYKRQAVHRTSAAAHASSGATV